MMCIIAPFVIWMLIAVFLSIKEQYGVICLMAFLLFFPCYIIVITIFESLGFNLPRNPCVKVNEIALISLHDNIYVGSSKDSDFYIYATVDGTAHALKHSDMFDVYIKQATENFRMEYWASHMSDEAFPSRAYYVFYIPENGVRIIN